MAAGFPSSRIPGGPHGDMLEMPGQLPQPSCSGSWTLCFLGPEHGWVCWETSTIYPPMSGQGGKPAGAWLCSHAALTDLSSFLQIHCRGNFLEKSKCGRHAGWVGTRVGWAVAVNFPLHPSWLTPRALHLAVPLPCISPTRPTASPTPTPTPNPPGPAAEPGSQGLGNIPRLCSAESR